MEKSKKGRDEIKLVFGCLSVGILAALLYGIGLLKKRQTEHNENTVVLPAFIPWLGVLCAVIFQIPGVVSLLQNDSAVTVSCFYAFSLVGAAITVTSAGWKITYDQQSFTVRGYWGTKRSYTYDGITGIRGLHKQVTLRMGKHSVRIDALARGKDSFIDHARKCYRTLHNGNAIPKDEAVKCDIFNGNILNPGEFLFIFILLFVFFLALFVFYAFMTAKTHPTATATVNFSSYEIKDDILRAYTKEDPLRYQIPGYDTILQHPEAFYAACDAGKSFTVSYEIFDNRYGVRSIVGEDGIVYLKEADVAAAAKASAATGYWAIGIINLVWAAVALLTIYMGRHAEKFSRKTLRLFFKDAYILVSKDG